MKKIFLEVLHEREIMSETSLEMLKGGVEVFIDCPNLTSCGCYKGNAVICFSNKVKPKPIDPPTTPQQ